MDLREECRGAKKIGISGHIRPDGDCVGVCLSLQMYLRKLLPEAEVTVYLQKPSEEFSYLKGYDEIQTECPVQEPFDVYFALDCSGDRLGDAETYFQNAKKKINIDHHISNSGCGDVNLVRKWEVPVRCCITLWMRNLLTRILRKRCIPASSMIPVYSSIPIRHRRRCRRQRF